MIGLVLTPARLLHGLAASTSSGLPRCWDRPPFTAIEPWYGEPAFVRLLAARVARLRWTASTGRCPRDLHRPLPARTGAGGGDTYPEQLEESARLVAAEAGLDAWSVAWQSAGRTPEPWLGPDIRDEVRRLAAEGDDRRRGGLPGRLRGRPPRGALRPRHRAGGRRRLGGSVLRTHGIAQRRSRPSSMSWPTS